MIVEPLKTCFPFNHIVQGLMCNGDNSSDVGVGWTLLAWKLSRLLIYLQNTLALQTAGKNLEISVMNEVLQSFIVQALHFLCFYKSLASMLAQKWDHLYSNTLCWLRCRLTFSLICSAIEFLRGARSSRDHAVHSPAPIDLAITESHITPDI